jgi:signal transduction histidine kinase
MADGLPTSTINRIIRDSLTNFWVGTPNGLAHFIPKQDPPKPAPAMLITRLIIAGKERSISELGERQISDLELENEQNNLEISFVSPSFGFAKAIGYECKLEGSDSDWRSINQRTINYSSLAAGAYRFLVRPVSADGTSSQPPASVSFRVLQPVWRRWWFVLMTLVLITVPIVGVARYRHQRMRVVRDAEEALRRSGEERLVELEQVRRRIATDLHDDIGSSLSQVYLLSEVVRQRVGPDDSEVIEPLAMISSASEEMVSSMSDIVWAINPQKDHLSDVILRMRRFASDTFATRDIAFRFSAPDADTDVRLGANIRREVFLIFKESVNNLVKHSGCTEAEVEFQMTDSSLLLRVSDNGKGFDASRDSDGHGLVSMRERAASVGGQFDLVSEAGRGTIVMLSIQLGQPRAPSVPANTGGNGTG